MGGLVVCSWPWGLFVDWTWEMFVSLFVGIEIRWLFLVDRRDDKRICRSMIELDV
jgi:hypothetical protein